MINILYISLGGIIGAVLRYFLSGVFYKISNFPSFPIGTLGVNLIGSFIIGFLYILFSQTVVPVEVKSFFLIGMIGSFTTFSTYAFETFALIEDREIFLAIWNILITNIAGLLLVFLGIICAKSLFEFFK